MSLFFNNEWLTLINGKCEDTLDKLDQVDVVVTSPPYNYGINYNNYEDNMSYDSYLKWIELWISKIKNVLNPCGSFFLNIGHKPSHTTLPYDVLNLCLQYFVLQNNFIWVKSISIVDENFGHFKPINSDRFVNDMWEHVFHFTHEGNVKLDRLSIGVPYTDKSNIERWSGKKDVRCRGNVWFIPYKTVTSEKIHPAQFPKELPLRCIKLTGCTSESVVLDPFIGVGNTALACRDVGCNCIGIDIDSYYLQKIKALVAQ